MERYRIDKRKFILEIVFCCFCARRFYVKLAYLSCLTTMSHDLSVFCQICSSARLQQAKWSSDQRQSSRSCWKTRWTLMPPAFKSSWRGGIRRIVVIDNGRGISEHELPLAMTRYATSKLHRLEELQAVQTLGFRGEALAAIASVAQLKLTSRQSGAPYPSTIDAQTREVKPAAGNIGTTVEVNDLYFSVPARLKFLKSETTEFGHCLEVIRRLALAHSEVVFSVSHNGRVIAYWPMGEPAQRITH